MLKYILVFVILALYLVSTKPSQAEVECQEWARKTAVENITQHDEPDDDKRLELQKDFESLAIEECLENGPSS